MRTLVVCAQSAAANISKCVQRCGLQIDDLVLSVLASSQAVLTSDERELGVILVDIGAGTTDIAVFVGGAIAHSASLPIAGDKVTEDIAHMLRTPTPEAEQIKVRYACALAQMATAEESIQVPSVGDRPPRRMPRASLAQAVQARYEEIFEMIQGRTAPQRLRAPRPRRHGPHRRRGKDGRRGRAGRGNAADAGARGHPAARHRSWRSGRQPGACHRRGSSVDGQPDRAPASSGDLHRSRRQLLQQAQELVSRRVLTMVRNAAHTESTRRMPAPVPGPGREPGPRGQARRRRRAAGSTSNSKATRHITSNT
ncbi:cell division protein FtsA [Lysobacter arenosi]|uniref:cell division protein FtsA n=1 Tax=Lysobacter arenosi TaxID=2795387 RepID=UPI003CE4ADF3